MPVLLACRKFETLLRTSETASAPSPKVSLLTSVVDIREMASPVGSSAGLAVTERTAGRLEPACRISSMPPGDVVNAERSGEAESTLT